jgi:hypothetical protein
VQARNAWPPLLVAAGLVAGLIVAVFEPTLYRSQVTLVIEQNGKPATGDVSLARSFAELATSDIVLRNVSQSIGTTVERDRLHVHAGNGIVKLSYDAGNRVQAARVAQQVAVDFSQAVVSRFGNGVQASIFDPPHDTGRVSPHILRDGGLGLLAGLIAAGVVWRRPRSRGLRERGRWRVSALSAAVEAAAAEHPDRIEDWRAYIAVLRAQADGDLLPYALDGVVREVFAPILPSS